MLPFDGEVFLNENIFSSGESDKYFELLKNNIAWKQEEIIMFGKKVMQPRLTALYGDANKVYRYSGITMHPLPWTTALKEIKAKVEEISGQSFSTALLNYYRTGQDSMGWHRDNEKELGVNPVIASVSFGAERIFQFRHYKDKATVLSVWLTHGSLLLMQGVTQHCWYHQLPKTKIDMAERINITFRQIKD